MEKSIYALQLQLHDRSATQVLHMKHRDTARQLRIHLVDGTAPYTIAPGCYAMLTAKNARGEAVFEHCTIDGNTIVYDVSAAATDAPGELLCQLRLYHKPATEGAAAQLLHSPRFYILVADTVCAEEDEETLQVQQNALDALVGSAIEAAENANTAAEDLRAAAENGEFDGEKGKKGDKGDKGDPGAKGADGSPLILCTAQGETIALTDAADRPLQSLTLYGSTTQAGTPTPDAPIPLESPGDSGTLTVTVDTQTLVVSTPNGLPGIPVTSGGNYTDASGQQWICDEIDFARGVYVQRVYKAVIDGSENYWVLCDGTAVRTSVNAFPSCKLVSANSSLLYFIYSHGVNDGGYGLITTYSAGNPTVLEFRNIQQLYGLESYTVDAWKAYLQAQYAAGTPVTVLYILETPVETALDSDTLAAYAALHTVCPNTTVTAGAQAELCYVADTKTYIDNKFVQLAAALTN